MMRPLTLIRAAVAAAAFMLALALVAWRQSRAFEALAQLDEARRTASVREAERIDMARTIQVLESRARVVPRARDELGMHMPEGTELVILSTGEAP